MSSTNSEDDQCFCISRRLLIHILNASSLIICVAFQGTILNCYLINHYKESIAPYFYFLADFLTMIVFAGTLTTSYDYLTKRQVIEEKIKKKAPFYTPARLIQEAEIGLLPWSHHILGVTPFSYISWLFYIGFMLSKVIIIFQSTGLIENLNDTDFLGPTLLKITISLASFVFFLLVEGHNWSKRGTERYAIVTSTCGKNGIEIFDAAAFLALEMEGNVTHSGFKDVVLTLSTFTFFWPALSLFKLSLVDFASEKTCLQVTVLQNVLRLTTVDIPFLVVRLFMWIYYHDNASMFLMKNIFNIIVISRTLCPDVKDLAEDRLGTFEVSTFIPSIAWIEDEVLHSGRERRVDQSQNRNRTNINL